MQQMIISSFANDKIIYGAQNYGFEVISADTVKNINPAVSGHPDMHIVKIDDILVVNPENYGYYAEKLKDKKIICGNKKVEGKYPEYIAYNIAITKNLALHNYKYTDEKIIEILGDRAKIQINQGYAKCSCITLDDAIITSDDGIIKACKNADIECLKVSKDGVTLDGMEQGFIGGASGYYNGVLYFSGDVARHQGYESIKKMCKKKCIEIVCLSNDKLADIGSIIIL